VTNQGNHVSNTWMTLKTVYTSSRPSKSLGNSWTHTYVENSGWNLASVASGVPSTALGASSMSLEAAGNTWTQIYVTNHKNLGSDTFRMTSKTVCTSQLTLDLVRKSWAGMKNHGWHLGAVSSRAQPMIPEISSPTNKTLMASMGPTMIVSTSSMASKTKATAIEILSSQIREISTVDSSSLAASDLSISRDT